MRLLSLILSALLFVAAPALATSSINPTVPAQGLPFNPAPIRLNFGAAVNDINALQQMNAGASAPASPQAGYLWLDTPNAATIYPLYLFDGNSWVEVAALDTANHLWIAPTGGGTTASILSATTTDLGTVPQSAVQVTGSNTISSFGSSAPVGAIKFVTFTSTPTLVNNATSLILPGGANISALAGDSLIAQETSAGNWRVLAYQPNVSPSTGTGGIGNIVAATTTDLGTVANASITVSGSTTIDSFGSTATAGTLKYLTFSGTPLLTYNATSLILPGGANIQVAAGDTALAQALGSGNWRVLFYQHVSATAVCFAGAAPPLSPTAGACWWNTTGAPVLYEVYDGASWLPVASVDTTNHIWQAPIGGGEEQVLASASTTDLGSVPAANVTVTGTTGINSFGSSAVIGTDKIVTFSGSLTVLSSSAIIVPGGTSITVEPGDVWTVKYLGSGNWRVIGILLAAGIPVTGSGVTGNAAVWTSGTSLGSGGAPAAFSVSNNAALQALSITGLSAGFTVYRAGFSTAGDRGAANYSLQTSGNCSITGGDNGSQVQPTVGTGCWLGQFGSKKIDPAVFGCVENGTTNDQACMQAAATFAGTFANNGFVDCGGAEVGLGSIVTVSTPSTGIEHCYAVVPTSGWSSGSTAPFFLFSGSNDFFEDNLCDGIVGSTATANCAEFTGQSILVENNYGFHYPTYGLWVNNSGSTGHTILNNNTMVEWKNTDSEFTTQANFVAKGLWFVGGDGVSIGDWPHYNEYNIYFGDGDVSHGATHWSIVADHPFNGCAGISGCARTDPVNIHLDKNSFANTFTNLYDDDGIIQMENDQNTFSIVNYVWDGVISLTARFHDIAQMANDVPSFEYCGGYAGANNGIPLISMDASGSNSWNTNVSALEAATYGSCVTSGAAISNFIGTSPTSAFPVAITGSSDPTCVPIQGKTPTASINICQDSNGDWYVSYNGSEIFFTNTTGNVTNRSPAVTCASGCGNGTLSSNAASMHGQFTVGSSTTSPVTLTSGGWGGVTPACSVGFEEPGRESGYTETASTIVLRFTSINAGDVVDWVCGNG